MKELIGIFIFILTVSCGSQTNNKFSDKKNLIETTDSMKMEYLEILDGLKLEYVLYYKNLKQTNTDLKLDGLPTSDSTFLRDSSLYFESHEKFFNQDYSFMNWLISYKNDTLNSGLWQKSTNPISSYISECDLQLSNSRAAIILLENFLNGRGFECYECKSQEIYCNKEKYNRIENFINNNSGKDISGLRNEWKKINAR